MNRVVLQSAEPVQQQIMATAAGAPNWWTVNYTRHPPPPPPPPPPPHHPFLGAPNTSNNNSSSYYDLFSPLYPPTTATQESLSQLLLGGLVNMGGGGEEGKCTVSQLFHPGNNNNNNNNNCNDNWDQDEVERSRGVRGAPLNIAIKQENPAVAAAAAGNHGYVYGSRDGAINGFDSRSSMLDFSNNRSNKGDVRHNPPPPDHHHHHRSSPECNSTGTSGALNKRARVQSPSSPFKVRKEKLGDRITALHQLVSPFGKTDTASVLLEAIGYIRFLQSQIEALSLPYLATSASATCRTHPHSAQGERNCIFPEHPGQLLNDNCMKRKGAPEQEYEEMPKKDLKSRGLCLVPVSCTLQVGSDNGADYWAPAPLGGPFDR